MNTKETRANIYMLLAAIIWGVAFIAQKQGASYVEPFTFNGIRFGLGSLSLLPLIYFINRNKNQQKTDKRIYGDKSNKTDTEWENHFEGKQKNSIIKAGIILGLVLFIGITLQQIGLKETTAGKAAFITGFYIVLVPIFGVFLKQKISGKAWIAAILSTTGLYFICITNGFSIIKGDLLEFISSFFWAAHIILTHKYTQGHNILKLSFLQYTICSVLSLCFAVLFEDIIISGILQASVPLLYGGIASVGVAYTLQAMGQKHAKPSHAAVILSMESVIAVIAGIIILGESMSFKGYLGCVLMFAGVLTSQLGSINKVEQTSSQAYP